MSSAREKEGNGTTHEIVHPPSIMPVVILRGSHYERGHQYGEQAAPFIIWKKAALWAKAQQEIGSRAEILRELKAVLHYIREATPGAIAGLQGMADGATAAGYPLSFTDVLLVNAGLRKATATASYPKSAEKEELAPEGCSSWSAWGGTTRDGRLICAKSSDSEFEPQLTIIAYPDEGHGYLATAQAGELADTPAMNDQGVFMGSSGGFAKRDIDFDYGVSSTCGYEQLLRLAGSAAEAKEIFLRWKYPRCTNVQFSDTSGDACVIEITAAFSSVRKAGDYGERDFIYSTNNYFADELKEAIGAGQFFAHGGWLGGGWSISSLARNFQIRNMLHNYGGHVDLAFAKMMWRFPGNPPPEGMDEKTYEETRGAGWDQKIGNRFNRRVVIMRPAKGRPGIAYVCTGSAGQMVHPLHPGGHCFPPEPTHSFYELTLAPGPAAVIEEARKAALRFISNAYSALAERKEGDGILRSLKSLWKRANDEYYNGIHAAHEAAAANGGEALRQAGRAATAFTRSQVHAKQVLHAFLPAPAKPEDMGLQPYGGPWATWAGR